MLDLGLLEVLLPEAYAMVAAGETRAGRLRPHPAGDRPPWWRRRACCRTTGLLAALLLPGILLRRYDVEAIEQRPLHPAGAAAAGGGDGGAVLARFTLSNLKAHAVLLALHDFNRLCEPGWKSAERVRFAHRPGFDDALFLFELLVEATGEGHEELAAVAGRASPVAASARSPWNHRAAARRRRRRTRP